MQPAHEGPAPQQILRFGPRRHGRADRRGDGVVDRVVLRSAKTRRERDLENEQLAAERRRIDVIRQSRAIAHAEAKKLRAVREDSLDPLEYPSFDRWHVPSLAPTILGAWSMATSSCCRLRFISQPR